MKKPDWWYPDKMYSDEDANIQIAHNSEYTLEEAIEFIIELGYTVKNNEFNYISYDPMMKEWSGYVSVKGEYE